MITVDVDNVFVSWLTAQTPPSGAGVASERPSNVQDVLPFAVVRRGGGGDISRWLDSPTINVDCYGATRAAVGALARWVDQQFRLNTPALFLFTQFTFLRCIQAPIKVPDPNESLHHMAAIYSFSVI